MKKVDPKLFFIALLIMFVPLLGHSSSIEENREFDQWFQKLDYTKPKLTRFHFYFHDIVTGPGQTTVPVVPKAKTVKPSTTLFGQIDMFDDPLTKGPDPTSAIVGRAQGLYGFASQEEFGLLMAMNIVFTSGTHNGSSVTLLGRNAVFQSRRELPIVGGTGQFRLARGFASLSSYFINATHGILEYDLMVMHY